MFKPAGFFAYSTKDGSEVVAATASLALAHWYLYPSLIKTRVVFTSILEIKDMPNCPGPYDPNFLLLIIARVERTFGKSPDIPSDLLSSLWYADLPEKINDYKTVLSLKKTDPKISAYEKVCSDILKWLEKNGDIVDLQNP